MVNNNDNDNDTTVNGNGTTVKDLKDVKVKVGPDLNSTKSQLDKKEYRQILLPNGLRVILVSDTIALHQEFYDYDSDEDSRDDKGGDKDKGGDSEDDKHGEGEMEIDEPDEKETMEDEEMEDDEDDEEEEEEDDGLRKAAAALIVGAGSFHDPPHAQGMAHYLEHMLFMGSTKYPVENQYDSFLSKNSGSDNAYTELEHTMFHLEVCQEKYFEALDMLAQFFISPLMGSDAVERELKSIESEFQLSKNSDECRLQQLFCHESTQSESATQSATTTQSATPKHPFGNFSWGNIKSLKEIPEKNGINMMKELRKFYNCHYYAQNMSLVVIGGYTLDELQKHVIKSFSDVPALPRMNFNSDANANEEEKKHDEFYNSMTIQRQNVGTWEQSTYTPIQKFGMPFNQHSLGRVCRIVPVKDKHNLTITWQIPPQWSNWKGKPVDYIAHLLGHEGKGSLLSSLKEKSFVNECYAGVGSGGYENASSHALFCMTFTLSEHGVSHWIEIVNCVYMYIGMIRHYCASKDGLPIWIYEELKAIQGLSYRFADEETPMDLCESIADSLAPYHQLPPERLLDGDSLLFEFNGDAIKDLVDNHMTPSNARIDIISSSFGRAADFEDDVNSNGDGNQDQPQGEDQDEVAINFSPAKGGRPLVEPIFGTQYWSHSVPLKMIEKWSAAAEPQLPPPESTISLPPVNPFIPKEFALKALPPDDGHHPLLFCSLKLCITVGKKKAWFPCTVNKYDGTKNRVLLVYEDTDEKWHKVDTKASDFSTTTVNPNFEGTLDSKAIKYKVISVPKEGEGAVLKYGDESDWHVDDGIHYPHVPPPLPESRLPQLVHNTKLVKLWHLQDRKFKRPVAELRLKMACLHANKSPLHRACAELLTLVIHDATTETCYLASVCELGNSMRATDFGFTFRVNGFDDKLLDLTDVLLKVIFGFNTGEDKLPSGINPSRFDACLEILFRRYNNDGMRASGLSSEVRLRCIRPTTWSSNEKAAAIKDITVSKFMEIISVLLKSLSIEALYIGNVDTKDAKAATKLISNAASASKGIAKNKHPKQEVVMVPNKGADHQLVIPTIDPKEPNTAVEMYIQCCKDKIEDRVLIDLLVQIMYEPLFDQLRTKEQLGYQVSCGSRWTNGVVGISFKVVTTVKSADDVNARIEEFLLEFRKDLVSMSKETFMENVVGLAKEKLEKFNSLEEEAGNLWYEITENRYDWEMHRDEAHALRSITKEQVIKAFDDWLCPTQQSRRRLTIHAIGTKEGVSSINRPVIPVEDVGNTIDSMVKAFHKAAGNKTYGKIM